MCCVDPRRGFALVLATTTTPPSFTPCALHRRFVTDNVCVRDTTAPMRKAETEGEEEGLGEGG